MREDRLDYSNPTLRKAARERRFLALAADVVTIGGRPFLASQETHEKGTGDCNTCQFWRSVGNSKYKGHRIPGGYGKCCRPGDACIPAKVRPGIGAPSQEAD